MGWTATLCPWCKCKKKKGLGSPAIFKGDPLAETKSFEDNGSVTWLKSYIDGGPCTSVQGDIEKTIDFSMYSAALGSRAIVLLNHAHKNSLDEAGEGNDETHGSQVVELVADMTTLSLIAAGKRNADLLKYIPDAPEQLEAPEGSFADLISRSFQAVILEIEDSVIIRDDGKEDRVDHHIALCGDILTSLWTTLEEFSCPGP